MSAIIGISDREIDHLDRASRTIGDLARITGLREHEETKDVLDGLLQRLSRQFGSSQDVRPGQYMLSLIQDILPPEESDDV